MKKSVSADKVLKYILILLVIISGMELLLPNILYGHDINFHIARIQGILDSVNSGNIVSLIYPGYLYGYGYANGIFYPDIFLYISVLLCKIGINIVNSYKIFLFLITIGLTYSMYYVSYKISNNKFTSYIVSIIYLMSSYRICDMYLRSALGETLTFIFLPIFILGIYYIFYDDYKKWYYYTIGIVGISCSHVISLVFCIILTIFFIIFNIKNIVKDRVRIKYLVIGGILSILLSMWFILPIIEQLLSNTFSFSNNLDMVVERAANPLYILLEIPGGTHPWQAPGIGIIFIFLIIYFINNKFKFNKFSKTCFIVGLILLFMSTSLFPWKIFKSILGIIQFPWRFYLLVTILFIIGFIDSISKIEIKKRKVFSIICIGISLFTYLVLSLYHYRFGYVNEFIKYSIVNGEYVPSNIDIDYIKDRGDIITSNNNINISYNRNGIIFNIKYDNNYYEDSYITLPLIYYKGYYAKDSNNNYLKVDSDSDGLVRVYLNNNSGDIYVNYGFTIGRKVGLIISIITFISLIFILYYKKKYLVRWSL